MVEVGSCVARTISSADPPDRFSGRPYSSLAYRTRVQVSPSTNWTSCRIAITPAPVCWPLRESRGPARLSPCCLSPRLGSGLREGLSQVGESGEHCRSFPAPWHNLEQSQWLNRCWRRDPVPWRSPGPEPLHALPRLLPQR